jgi:hypothetical protein
MRILSPGVLLTALLAAPSAGANDVPRAQIRSAIETAWQRHASDLASAANAHYPKDEISLEASVGKIRVGKRTVRFEGLLKWSPHRVTDALLKGSISRDELDQHLAGGAGSPLCVEFGGRTESNILRSLSRRRWGSEAETAVDLIENPGEIRRYVAARYKTDPLAPERIAEALIDNPGKKTAAAWWLAIRSLDVEGRAQWGAPRPTKQVIAALRRRATSSKTGTWLTTAMGIEHPEEIRGVVDFVARGMDPNLKGNGLKNLRFLAGELYAPLQKVVWLKAIDEVEQNPPPQALASERRPWPAVRSTPRLVAQLERQAKREKIGDWLLVALRQLKAPAEIRKIVRAVAGMGERAPGENAAPGLDDLRFLVSEYDGHPTGAPQQAWLDALAELDR